MHDHLLPAKREGVKDIAVKEAVNRYVDQVLGLFGSRQVSRRDLKKLCFPDGTL